jgi:hypothetical protein
MRARVNIPPSAREATALVIGIGAVGYAWWATGLRPFTRSADVAIAIPVFLLAVAAWGKTPRSSGGASRFIRKGAVGSPSRYGALPWIALGLLAVALEVLGLALGGRSRVVPTLSTVADQALAWHVSRWVVFILWLAAGAWPVRRVT